MDVIIVNPISGHGRGLGYLEGIKEIYDSANREYLVMYTRERITPMLTRAFAQKDDVENIVSIGGDGTLNEIVNGMMDTKKGLIVVPGGTGNDFYRSISSYNDSFMCDVGKANNNYFLGTLSIGLDAIVANYANKLKEKNFKGNAYVASTLCMLPQFKSIDTKLCRNDHEEAQKITLLSFSNTPYYGGGIKISPNSSITDGLLDCHLVRKMPNFRLPIVFFKLLKGTHEDDSYVENFKTDSSSIVFPQKTLYSCDGETYYDKRIDVSIFPQKLYINKEFDDKIKKLIKN